MAVAELESVRQHGIMHPTLGDVVWPALILEGRILTWYAIAAGLAAEYLFVRSVTDLSLTWALAADVAMNAASTLLGVVLLPVVGLVWEFLPGRVINSVFNTGTFNPGSWLATILLSALLNTFIERFVLRGLFGQPVVGRRGFWLLFAGNVISVALAFASLFVLPPKP